jgi:hypothetical protein
VRDQEFERDAMAVAGDLARLRRIVEECQSMRRNR